MNDATPRERKQLVQLHTSSRVLSLVLIVYAGEFALVQPMHFIIHSQNKQYDVWSYELGGEVNCTMQSPTISVSGLRAIHYGPLAISLYEYVPDFHLCESRYCRPAYLIGIIITIQCRIHPTQDRLETHENNFHCLR